MRFRFLACLILGAACQTNLAVDSHDKIACSNGKQCPSAFFCETSLGVCLPTGSDPATESVTFTLPHDGDTNVSTTGQIVIALTLPVDLASAALRVHLTDSGGNAVALAAPTAPESATLVVAPTASLVPLTTYTFTLDADLAADSSSYALPSPHATTLQFTTGQHRDTVPPGPVSNVLIEQSAERADLSWSNPVDSDWAGVVVVANFAAALVLDPGAGAPDFPTQGTSYAVGSSIGAGTAFVAAVVSADQVSVVNLQSGFYDWAFFAMDSSTNYSTPTHVPFVSATQWTWCPSGQGTYVATSPDDGLQSLLLDNGTQTQTTPSAIGTTAILKSPDVSIDTTYTLRFSVTNADGEYRSISETFIASDPLLGTHDDPGTNLKVPLGGTAAFGFNAFEWPIIHAQVDSDPAIGEENWLDLTTPLQKVGNTSNAVAQMNNAGEFAIQVRAEAPNCDPGPWQTSSEFLVGGGARYVSQALGSDTAPGYDGSSRVTAYKSLDKAMVDAWAASDMDIYVSEGTYAPTAAARPNGCGNCGSAQAFTQGLVVPSHTRLYGGYSDDFLTRDVPIMDSTQHAVARQYETIIQGFLNALDYIVADSNSDFAAVVTQTGTSAITLDGFTIEPVPPAPTDGRVAGVYFSTASGGTLNNNHIHSCPVTGGSSPVGMAVDAREDGAGLFITNNWLDPTSSGGELGVNAESPGGGAEPLTISGNLITSAKGIFVFQNDVATITSPQPLVDIEHNRIIGDPSPALSFSGNETGFECDGAANLKFLDNYVQPSSATYDFATSTALLVNFSCFGIIANNVFDGGVNSQHSNGISIGGTIPLAPGGQIQSLLVSNNIIFAGMGTDQRTAINWFGSGGALANGDIIVAHNDVLATNTGSASIGRTTLVDAGSDGGAYVGRFINNIFFGLWSTPSGPQPPPGLMTARGNMDSWQNNLIVNDNQLQGFNRNGSNDPLASWVADWCDGGPYQEAVLNTGTVISDLSVGQLFKSFAGDAAAYSNIEAADFTPVNNALAMGLDTRQNACGGIGNAGANACPTTPPTTSNESCGNVTLDAAGRTRPSTPAVGAYEFAP